MCNKGNRARLTAGNGRSEIHMSDSQTPEFPVPPRSRMGRPMVTEPRVVPVLVKLSVVEADMLDEVRAGESRAGTLRRLAMESVRTIVATQGK